MDRKSDDVISNLVSICIYIGFEMRGYTSTQLFNGLLEFGMGAAMLGGEPKDEHLIML